MKKQFAYALVAASLAIAPLVLTSGCASSHSQETTSYAKDKDIAAKIKNKLYADPTTKGTEIEVQSLNGEVQLSGFVDSQIEKDRAGQIASAVPGVIAVHNNLLLPTGR